MYKKVASTLRRRRHHNSKSLELRSRLLGVLFHGVKREDEIGARGIVEWVEAKAFSINLREGSEVAFPVKCESNVDVWQERWLSWKRNPIF